MELMFFRCSVCGQIIAIVKKTGVPVVCCGKPMEELIPGTVDASREKHVPICSIQDNILTVSVGSAPHPMLAEHFIEWIAVQTKYGNHYKALNPGDEPRTQFILDPGDEVQAVYAYCNLHSLWKA